MVELTKVDSQEDVAIRLVAVPDSSASESCAAGDGRTAQESQTPHASASEIESLRKTACDPSASEEEWISACTAINKLEQNDFAVLRNEPRKWKSSFRIFVAALCTAIVAGAAGYFLPTAFNMKWEGTQLVSNKEVDFGPYMNALESDIKSHWNPPTNYGKVKVHFKVDRSGHISDVGFIEPMGYTPSDLAALKAVLDSGHVAPLPPGSPESVDIAFTFEYTNLGDKH